MLETLFFFKVIQKITNRYGIVKYVVLNKELLYAVIKFSKPVSLMLFLFHNVNNFTIQTVQQ